MEIEKGIELPESAYANKREYPFNEMQIGDSLFFPGEGHHSNGATAARVWAGRNGVKFSARVQDGGIRVWRVS